MCQWSWLESSAERVQRLCGDFAGTLRGLCGDFVQALCGGAGLVSEFEVVRVGRHSKWRKLSLLAGIHDAGMVHP